MVIAVLGWGSLVWDKRDLPLASEWFFDGPELPLEFARISSGERFTLVIHGEHKVPVCWAEMSCSDLKDAHRENCISPDNQKTSRNIGWWENGGAQSSDKDTRFGHKIDVSGWAKEKGLKGVVWTALPPKFGCPKPINGQAPKDYEAVGYLEKLSGDGREAALEYIRKAPEQINTPYRKAFTEKFSL